MAHYYADSSALVKRHVREIGTAWFQQLANPTSGNVIVTARISLVEVYSAFNRRVRENQIVSTDYTKLAADFAACCEVEYQLVELTPMVVNRSRQLLERHPLRGYDAIQLATALLTQSTLIANALSPLTFLTADERLLAVAQVEGLLTDNPIAHP